MAYSTALQWAQRSGMCNRAVDENVGTGDNSQLYFDLDFTNVIAGSYTLNYAASGSNNFTALTETTHYSIPDLESGRIILTSAGRTALGTNVLYATYSYSKDFPSSVITNFITVADAEINKLTGKNWGTATNISEYYSGRRNLPYPTTDNPYVYDWDQPDFIILKNYPVTKIRSVFFLNTASPIAKFYNYDDSGVSYTEYTDNVNDFTEGPFTAFAATPAANDIIYIGSDNVFLGLNVVLSTDGTGSPAIDWEYYNGSAWTDITETEIDSGSSTLTASGKFTWTYPYGWTKTSVNSNSYYWLRGKLTVGYTIAPVIASLTMQDAVYSILQPKDYSCTSNGRLNFLNTKIPDGTENVRVDYTSGMTSTPEYITELSIIIATIQAVVALSGGSFDELTAFTLGSKSFTVGEQYVNLERTLLELKGRMSEILKMVGSRANVTAI